MIKASGKLQQPNPGRITSGSDPSGMKVWATPLRKEPWPAKVLVKGKRNMEWTVEEASYKYQLEPCDQLQKQKL